ncbi:MAG: digeranylgeranylglyceryl phosphate synthase [Candidatus Aenigmatarchaeota archaeon]|nr:MAG: digeranylgeranylglyceryl phosphate synthase [Candidatus Aenigmarchaeota archaeon]
MFPYLELMRPSNCLMSSFAVIIGAFLIIGKSLEQFISYQLLLGIVAVFLITGAGNAVNDWFDVEADKINRPKRPIPSERVSRNSALIFSIMLFVLGIIMTGFINWICFAIALINSALLVLYSKYLQNKMFIGNAIIAYLTGSTFLFGGAIMGNIYLPLILMFLAGFVTFSREIVKDIEDIEGDKLKFLKDAAVKIEKSLGERFGISKKGVKLRYSRKTALTLASISLVFAVTISPLPYLVGILHESYLITVIFADLIFLSAIYMLSKCKKSKDFGKVSKRIKIGMFFGLVSFIVGVLL